MDRVPLQDKLRMRGICPLGHDYRGMVEQFRLSRVCREASMLESGVGVKVV